MEPDFGGWATKAGMKCADGLTIMPDAFAHNDGVRVPLVWNHQYGGPENILGHALLRNRKEGVWVDCYFNDTDQAATSKELLKHGDINALSIVANELVKKGKDVIHGQIREVSLVLSGANPGALIQNVNIQHSDGSSSEAADEAVIYTGEELIHSGNTEGETMAGEKTVEDVFKTLNDEQLQVVHSMLSTALETPPPGVEDDEQNPETDENENDDDELEQGNIDKNDENTITHSQEGTPMGNVFENAGGTREPKGTVLTHSQLMTVVEDAKKNGSFKESLLSHAGDFGINEIELLFPDAKAVDNNPEWITREMDWVRDLMDGVRKLPYSKIKSLSADLTYDTARAKGYIKGTMKKEQFFDIAKRETGPTTVYKKQKLDRDDMIDITEMDVVAWLWGEMRFMLKEEIARAILIGDGREIDDDDKIDEKKIRPIAHDDEFYTDVLVVPTNTMGDALIEAVLRGRPKYKGNGLPVCYTTEETLTDLILLKDKMGRRLYPTQAELEAALRVNRIVTVEVMEDAAHEQGDLLMVLVKPSDYSVGTTRGGEISEFTQFDIDYNQEKYLIEGRMSGCLTKHKTAQVVVRTSGTETAPVVPTFDANTGVVTTDDTTGVVYYQDNEEVILAGAQDPIAAGETTYIEAVPADGYHFPANTTTTWTFTRNA